MSCAKYKDSEPGTISTGIQTAQHRGVACSLGVHHQLITTQSYLAKPREDHNVMTDAGIGVAGLALAVPGVIDLMLKYGEWIYCRVQTFQNAKAVWTDLGKFGWSLSQGELKELVVAAKSFLLEEGCDPGLKNALELQIQRLAFDVLAARKFLEDLDPSRLFVRVILALSGERRAKELNKTIRIHEQGLAQILMVSDIRTRRVPDELLLTRKRFQQYENFAGLAVPFTSNLFVAKGDYREHDLEGPYREVTVIIERTTTDEQAPEDILKEITSFLCYRLPDKVSLKSADVLRKGILPCLGYRMQPAPELIFELPKDTRTPQTLQTLIATDQGVVRQPLDFRFRLARRLSEAVLRVHAARLVHKNIRTETVLVLQPNTSAVDEDSPNAVGFGDVYLTNWRLLRDDSGPTMKSGGNQWTEDLYRHPKRQGIHVQERYNMGHDIYSLGVCLLEIGLWDLLIPRRTAGGQARVSELFRGAAGVEDYPDPEVELREKLSRPTDVKNILLRLASENLPPRMGLGYGRLVAACLTGLDQPSGFGPEVDLTKMKEVEQGVAFKELVLSFFTEMSY